MSCDLVLLVRSDRRGGACVAEFTVLGGFGTVSLGSVATVWECGVMYLFRLGNWVWKCDAAVGIRDRGAVLMVITCFLSTIERTVCEGHGAFFFIFECGESCVFFSNKYGCVGLFCQTASGGEGRFSLQGNVGAITFPIF